MLDDMKKYFALGNIFSREKIEGIRADVTQIRNLQEALAKSDEVKHLCTNAAFGESCRRKIT